MWISSRFPPTLEREATGVDSRRIHPSLKGEISMKIGDHVRDKGTEFVGTVVELEPPTGTAIRVLIQADQAADKMWQKVEELELIDVEGKRVTGKAGKQLDAPVGGAVDASAGKTSKSAAGASASR
jgi:hypothetical protein